MNNKGFTLTELIVTMAIISVISLISLPAITELQKSGRQAVYESYEKVLVNGAKLYVDKYDRDLFLRKETNPQCVSITYDNLKNEDLIKEFKGRKGEKVNSDATYINATKSNGSVTYEVAFEIDRNGSKVYQKEIDSFQCLNINISGENETK